ncbi:MAG TPA: molybdopterin synthase sulfur carrier subunit [Gammaproteobacteria bacterium]|nr:molybdopterin synthase sulfur carrier subunit [Gammaproteobacteria bacterium]
MARILYFAYLVDKLGRAAEDLPLPAEVADVRGLLALLRKRGGIWEKALAEDRVQVLVNKQFASLDTPVTGAQEIAIVSNAPG